jgi:predicted RNA-binding protein
LSGALAVETRRAAAAEAVTGEVVTGEVVTGEVPGEPVHAGEVVPSEPVHAGETGRVDLADWQRSWGT